jgi:hypothetical protein
MIVEVVRRVGGIPKVERPVSIEVVIGVDQKRAGNESCKTREQPIRKSFQLWQQFTFPVFYEMRIQPASSAESRLHGSRRICEAEGLSADRLRFLSSL